MWPTDSSGVTNSLPQSTGEAEKIAIDSIDTFNINLITNGVSISSTSVPDNGTAVEDVARLGTITSSEAEVANGFVKNGSSLPYVFETSETGKREKILPFCALCNKKFVCVTTMKRHLVTHTGEKPFSCQVCGKQYTQKGNLRVHERTHRGERPFECNICHLTFYRKEPMQKHQWRQHAIVHFKSRPTNQKTCQDGQLTSVTNNNTSNQGLGIIGAEGVLYNSLIEQIKVGGSNGGIGQNDETIFEMNNPQVQPLTVPSEKTATVTEHHPAPSADPPAGYVSKASGHNSMVENFSEDEDEKEQKGLNSVTNAVAQYLQQGIMENEEEQNCDSLTDNPSESLVQFRFLNNSNSERNIHPENIKEEAEESKYFVNENEESNQLKPMKLKMKLAQAYMREVKEEREREERDSREREGRDFEDTSLCGLNNNINDIQISSNQIAAALQPQDPGSELVDVAAGGEKESVECQCKSCGNKCFVTDPYNFRCGTCNVKYTSLPIHMIADPLQCIGCLQVFAHKPAMKTHQAAVQDKERPFRCCRCGYEFRQKAHLQKHQWRIHRRKLEPDPNVKEAEAILHAVSEMTAITGATEATLTIQQIIDRGVEREIKKDEAETGTPGQASTKPLDLSPTKMYGTAKSITKWVQQVETARTPIIPDISIHKKESGEGLSPLQLPLLPTEPLELSIVNQLIPNLEDSNLTIQLLEPQGIKWPTEPIPQTFAIKSKPEDVHISTAAKPGWRNHLRADNPLLNQVSPPIHEPNSNQPSNNTFCLENRSSKRARTELHFSSSSQMTSFSLPPISSLNSPSSKPFKFIHQPLMDQNYPTDLSKNKHNQIQSDFSPPSPPLNLSTDNFKSRRFELEDSPFDYRIGRSDIISGQLNRLKNQDERGGI